MTASDEAAERLRTLLKRSAPYGWPADVKLILEERQRFMKALEQAADDAERIMQWSVEFSAKEFRDGVVLLLRTRRDEHVRATEALSPTPGPRP